MKILSRRAWLFFSSVIAISSSAMANVTFAPGDLFVVFYEYSGTTTAGLNPNSYVFKLGQSSLFRDSTLNNVPVTSINPALTSGNIGSDLATAFGEDWASSGTVRWALVGLIGVSDGTVAGDPARTSYYSASRVDGISTVPAFTTGIYGTFNTQLLGFQNGVNSSDQTTGSNMAGAIIPISEAGSIDEYLPPQLTGQYFGSGNDPRQTFNAGLIPGSSVEGALDIYRMTNTTAGRTGSFISTLTIDGGGNLKIANNGQVPANNYASFATANNLGAPTADADNDGIINLVEYALNLNLAGADGSAGAFANGTLSFTKRAVAVSNGDLTYAIEESDDLGVSDPWQTVTATSNTSSAITYALPTGKTKVFARLKVTSTP